LTSAPERSNYWTRVNIIVNSSLGDAMCFDQRPLSRRAFLGGTVAVAAAAAAVDLPVAAAAARPRQSRFGDRYVLAADQVFDGTRVLEHHAVAVADDTITAVAPTERLRGMGRVVRLAGGTLLPGFIDLHAHLLFGGVRQDQVLGHGITTVRDLGGPLARAAGGDGHLRVLTAGPILTAPGGYPIPLFGSAGVALEIPDPAAATAAVRDLAAAGASLIKVALEPGGSPGAPWTPGPWRTGPVPTTPPPWPIPGLDVVRAVVDEAHRSGLVVAAHLSGPEGAALALDAGVDEWAHVPCDPIPHELVVRAARAGVGVVATLDTQSHCTGVMDNAQQLIEAGVRLLYGTDLAHPEIPWGIDAQELAFMLQAAHGRITPVDVLAAATARAGEQVGLAPLGQLVEGAPADIIGVRGDPLEQLKVLEYPDVVVSGGAVVIAPDEP
jgi:imidazolonepropionase-like amidohydrolase